LTQSTEATDPAFRRSTGKTSHRSIAAKTLLEAPLGGFYTKPSEIPGLPFWIYYITTQDVHEAVQQVEDLGGRILNGPMEVPGGGSILQCMDPQGAAFVLYSEGPRS